MSNRRIFYAVEQAGFSINGGNTFTPVHGLQSIGINTKFNLEQVFEVGQISIYANLENIPDIEVTMEKVLDGYPPIYLLATNGSASPTLVGRSAVKTTLGLSIFSDQQQSASGTPLSQCTMSGMFVSALSYTIPTQGHATESVTLVGQNKIWSNTFAITTFNNLDQPFAGNASGNVNRRQDILFGSAASLLPGDIPGISASGTNELQTDGTYSAHLTSVKISTNLGREALYELGRRGVYFRYVNFPVQIQSEWEAISQQGDNVTALEDTPTSTTNLRTLYIKMREGTKIDLGSQNKLSATTYSGANAGANGGNATMTYSYITFNDLTVTHPQDPSPGLAA